MNKLFKLLLRTIRDVEHKSSGGEGKRKIAVDLINAAVDIPLLPEFIEEKVIGLLVDFAIWFYNEHFGHDWIEKS